MHPRGVLSFFSLYVGSGPASAVHPPPPPKKKKKKKIPWISSTPIFFWNFSNPKKYPTFCTLTLEMPPKYIPILWWPPKIYVWFKCSKEPSHGEYLQLMFWLRNKKLIVTTPMHEPAAERENKHFIDDAWGEVLSTPRGTKTAVGTSNTMENNPFRNWENLQYFDQTVWKQMRFSRTPDRDFRCFYHMYTCASPWER